MPRSVFTRTLTLFVLMAVKNRVQLAFLADGRRRARKAYAEFDRETARVHADLAAASFRTLPPWE